MSSATLLKHPVAYMTADGPGATMSNFMTGFPPAQIFGSPQYFSRGRAGDPGISPFFVPNQAAGTAYAALPEFPVYSHAGHYGGVPYSGEHKPVVQVCESQSHEIANALLALNSKPACSTTPGLPQDSTPPTSSAVRTFGEEHHGSDLISTLRMSATAYAPGEPIYEVARSNTNCLQDYPQDVKPIIPVPNYRGGDSPTLVSPSLSERSPSSKSRNRTPSKSGNNICQICGKSYARPSTLKTHMRTHSGEKPYRCEVCGKAFTQAANLTAHLRTHSGEKPFSCPICQKRFSQSSSVTTHLRTHSGERPYRCDFCGKAFADTSTLTKHKRIHSGEKPYRCKICNLGFSQSGNLHRHMKTHSN